MQQWAAGDFLLLLFESLDPTHLRLKMESPWYAGHRIGRIWMRREEELWSSLGLPLSCCLPCLIENVCSSMSVSLLDGGGDSVLFTVASPYLSHTCGWHREHSGNVRWTGQVWVISGEPDYPAKEFGLNIQRVIVANEGFWAWGGHNLESILEKWTWASAAERRKMFWRRGSYRSGGGEELERTFKKLLRKWVRTWIRFVEDETKERTNVGHNAFFKIWSMISFL